MNYEDKSRSGDVYHPDFQHGHPAYFDVSVHSTTQPSHISFSSSCAGVAAAAGELAKDHRHQDVGEEAGCDFVPLVVETFGVWSPFALQTLRTIAERTTAISGASTKQAHKHLLQQFSVPLWTNPFVTTIFSFFMDEQCPYDFTVLGFAAVAKKSIFTTSPNLSPGAVVL